MKLLRFFKGHVGAVLLCAVLLVIQANLELSLPNYMSNIVDVGLIQGGIEVPQETLDAEGVSANDSEAVGRIVEQMRQQYEADGVDLSAIQRDYLLRTAAIMFGLCLGTLVTTICVGLVASRTAATVARDTRQKLFRQVMNFSPAEVGKFSQASLITRTTNDLQQIQMVIVIMLRMIMLAPIMGIVAFLQVTATHSGMEWIIGVAILAILAVLGVLFGLTMPKFKRIQSLVDRLNLVSRDMLDGLMPIRAFGRERFEVDRFNDASGDLMHTQLFVNRAMAFMMPIIMLVMNVITLLIVWVGTQGVEVGTMQVGTMMAFITYAMQIVMSFMILGMVAVMLPRAQVSAERVAEVIDCPLSITDPANPQTPAATSPRGQVEFKNVSFSYPDADRAVVQNVSFTTEAGKTLGIIGSTGSGKTTLVKLIPRLYDATEGSVLIDGVDVRDMTVSDVRSRIGYVPQQGFLFSGTIESNIKFADEEMPDSRMEKAAAVAQASEFIEKEPEGFATPIAQKGSNVSGGQRQRLSIARALAADPEILVFDDAFSALDYATDAKLREALRTGSGDAAVVIVAQRVATIMQADEILVLENGSVVGRGTHQELLNGCDTYREIALSQLSAAELGLEDSPLVAEARQAEAVLAAEDAAPEEGGDA